MTARWPRMMKRKTAAEYVDMSESAFEAEVARGTLPGPVLVGGRDHWCIKALDSALDALSGQGGVPDYRRKLMEKYA